MCVSVTSDETFGVPTSSKAPHSPSIGYWLLFSGLLFAQAQVSVFITEIQAEIDAEQKKSDAASGNI